ncbi:MAG: cysteine hydrolase [Chloroflexi bacterium]|nr:cysteine hydrolase [Chloroflexota bacterium]
MWNTPGKLVYETLAEVVHPGHSALIVIDVQNDNASPRGCQALNGRDISWIREAALPNIKRVLAKARKLGIMVIFARNTRTADGTIESGPRLRYRGKSSGASGLPNHKIEGTWGHEVLDELEPRPGERQITKYRSSAFIGTPLDLVLRGNGIESVVVAGVVTEFCVLATVNDLLHYGYYAVVLSDCVASNNPKLHEAALLIMSHRCDVSTSAELLEIWQKSEEKLLNPNL